MKLICDFSSNLPPRAKEKANEYLFFSDVNDLDFIWPIQSEMNVFD